jgi:phospholipid/cholesterol/gamma-HCH transport system substrate-binding protein
MNEQSVRFRLGIFVLGALILLAVLVMLFGGWGRLFQQYHRYTIVFDNASGVAPGTPVRRSGVRIGEVESVELDSQTNQVRVGIKIGAEYVVRKNDVPTITRSLLGDTSIDFVAAESDLQPVNFIPGQAVAQAPENPPVPPGSTLRGRSRSEGGNVAQQGAELLPVARDALIDMRKVLARFEKTIPLVDETLREYRDLGKLMSGLVPEFAKTNDALRQLVKSTNDTLPELRRSNDEIQITARNWGKLGERLDVLLQANDQKLTKALDQLNESLRRINTTFNDENQKNLADTLKNARDSSARLDSIAQNTDELIKQSRKTMEKVNSSVARADEVFGNLQQATKPMAERTPSIMKNLDESSAKLNLLLSDLGGLFRGFGRGDGTLQRLMSDPALYNHLNEAACLLARSMPRLDRVLGDLEIFADKLARHPEAIGLGGVVRPSSGLKDVPSSSSWQGAPPH